VRLLVLGDRNPEYLTHREIDAALALMQDGVDSFEGFHFCGYALADRFARVLERSGVTIAAPAPAVGAPTRAQ
jgi:hypothetical protein